MGFCKHEIRGGALPNGAVPNGAVPGGAVPTTTAPTAAAMVTTTESVDEAVHGGAISVLETQLPQESELLDYEPDTIRMLSNLSGWSYSDVETFRDKVTASTMRHGFKIMQISVVNDAFFVVAYAQIVYNCDTNVAYVSFRGTEPTNPINWLTDAGTRQALFHGLRVHSGFLMNLESIWDGPRGIVRHLQHPQMLDKDFDDYYNHNLHTVPTPKMAPIKHIYLTGHSLGGAMAVLAAVDLQARYPELWQNIRGIYTFGQPMVVAEPDRARLDERLRHNDGKRSKLLRFVYYNDIVPHLPPLTAGVFDHVGEEYRYRPLPAGSGRWERRHGFEWGSLFKPRATQVPSIVLTGIPALLDFVFYNVQYLHFLKSPWSFQDHNPINYIHSFQNEHDENMNHGCIVQ